MVYSSLLFIYGFLPVSILLFYITPKKFRELTLLFLSAVFCGMISLYFLIFILAYTAVNYGFVHLISRLRKNKKLAAVPLAAGIIIDIAALIVFRTEHFAVERLVAFKQDLHLLLVVSADIVGDEED